MDTLNSLRWLLKFIIFSSILLLFASFIPAKKTYTALNYIPAQNRVAILIARHGNQKVIAPMNDITLTTNYSARPSNRPEYFFIDSEERLAESVPEYPKIQTNEEEDNQSYYKNLTPEITGIVKKAFEVKNYNAFDFTELSDAWAQTFSEMDIDDILTSLKGVSEYLFIMHYMDVGGTSVHSEIYKLNAVNCSLSSIIYAYSLFDVPSKKRLFSYAPLMGFITEYSLLNNPAIMNDPQMRKRITVDCESRKTTGFIAITYDFTENELLQLFSDALLNGFKCSDKKFIDCYDKCGYYTIKGLNSFLVQGLK